MRTTEPRYMIILAWSGQRAPMSFGTWTRRDRAEAEADRWRSRLVAVWPDQNTRPGVLVQSILPARSFQAQVQVEIDYLARFGDVEELLEDEGDEEVDELAEAA